MRASGAGASSSLRWESFRSSTRLRSSSFRQGQTVWHSAETEDQGQPETISSSRPGPERPGQNQGPVWTCTKPVCDPLYINVNWKSKMYQCRRKNVFDQMVQILGNSRKRFELKNAHCSTCSRRNKSSELNSGESGLPEILSWRYLHHQYGGGKQTFKKF